MRVHTKWMTSLAAGGLAWTLGCGGFGRVEQGRVVAYQPEEGLLTVILDSNDKQPAKPRYDVLPPVAVRVPRDPGAMGPAPRAGGLLELDVRNRQAVIFDATGGTLLRVPCGQLEVAEGVAASDPRVAGAGFPRVDRARRRVSLYFAQQRRLVSFTIPEEYLALPDSAWIMGDEVRYYFKEPGQALRLMNVTRTEIS